MNRSSNRTTVWLSLACASALACGATHTGPAAPEGDARDGVAPTSTYAQDGGVGDRGGAAEVDGGAVPGSPARPGTPVALTAVVPTQLDKKLVALGLDPAHLPPLDRLQPNVLRKVMKLFVQSLGVQCTTCHSDDDFGAPTPQKAIATHMWNDIVRRIQRSDGGPVFCDSCHQGRSKLLDRRDEKALGAWMQAQLVDGMQLRDGGDHSCATCHGEPFEGSILRRWAKGR